MLRVVLLCSGLCGAVAIHVQTSKVPARARPPPATAFWPCKNGDLRRSGASSEIGPRSLSRPVWSFREARGYGAIESTPVIDGSFNTFIATTAGGLFALQRNGSLLWSHRLHGRVMTPALVGGTLYVATSQGDVHAFDAATGARRWKRQYAPEASGDAWSVTAAGGVVLVPGETQDNDGNHVIFALNASDGSMLWHFEPVAAVYNFMPAVVERSVLFVDKTGGMYRLALRDGKVMWKTSGYGAGSMSTGGLAMSSSGQIFATSNRDGKGVIHAHSIEDGALLWTRDFEMEASAAPAVIEGEHPPSIVVSLGKNPGMGGAGLVHHGRLVALDTSTGAERWSFKPPVHLGLTAAGVLKGMVGKHMAVASIPDTWSNPAVGADGTVYIGWMGGIVFALDGHSGKEIARHDVGLSFQGEPAIAPGFLVVPSIFEVLAFDAHREGGQP